MKTRILFSVLSIAVLVSVHAGLDPLGPVYHTATAPSAGVNCIQTITFGGTPTAGTFTLSFAGKTTGAISWNATNGTLVSNIDTALEALATIGASGVTTAVGTMTAGIGTITVTFAGTNVAKRVEPVITGVSSLTGTAPTLAVAITTAGVDADGRDKPRGTVDVADDTGLIYTNTGTPPNPTWTKPSAQ